MENKEFIKLAKEKVVDYHNSHAGKEHKKIVETDVLVTWYCYTLGNQKARLTTTARDGMDYEITYDLFLKELYFDAYKKQENICFKL